VAGTALSNAGGGAGTCFDLVKLTPTGAPDTTFGPGDGAGHAALAACSVHANGQAVAVASSGSVFVAGSYYNTSLGGYAYGVARYENGWLNTSFGNYGVATLQPPGATEAWGYAVAVDASGRVLVGGSGGVARLTSAGRLDTTFGNGGWAAGSPVVMATNALAVQVDGSIVAAGQSSTSISSLATGIVAERFTPSGQIDTTFGAGGATRLSFGKPSESSWAQAVNVRGDGSIVLAGTEQYASGLDTLSEAAIVKLTSAGALDTGFAGTGSKLVDLGYMAGNATSVVEAPDGSIIVGGWTQLPVGNVYTSNSGDAIVLANLFPNGALNTAWGNGGFFAPQYVDQTSDSAQAMAISGGKLVSVGTAGYGGVYECAARYDLTTVTKYVE